MINFSSLRMASFTRQFISAGWAVPPLVCPLLVLFVGKFLVMFSHYF